MDTSRTWVLPAYSPAIDTPHYTTEPGVDEERLQISGRLPPEREQTGVFVERTKHVILALTNQAPNCKEPAYGRGGMVRGSISPLRLEGIMSVEVKLEAVLAITMTSVVIAGKSLIPLFAKREVLFEQSESRSDSKPTPLARRASQSRNPRQKTTENDHCPSTLTFAIRIPTAYSHEGIPRALPPSYLDHFSGVPGSTTLFASNLSRLTACNHDRRFKGLSLDSRYTLYITIHRKGQFGRDKKTVLTQPINFAPRSRPAHPALPPSLTFLSTLKSSPEEWKLFEAETALRDGHDGTPVISSALLLPRSQIFPMHHAIPFHLQLSCASAQTLAQYTPHVAPNFLSNAPNSLMALSTPSISMRTNSLRFSNYPPPIPLSKSNNHPVPAPETDVLGELFDGRAEAIDVETSVSRSSGRIYISVQRHVAVHVKGQWLQLKRTLGTSTFKRCPTVQSEAGNPTIAWEGHIHGMGEGKCGEFGAPGVRVKDYILLSVIPPHSDHAPLQEIRHLIPIRLTTEPYNEDILLPDVELAHHAI